MKSLKILALCLVLAGLTACAGPAPSEEVPEVPMEPEVEVVLPEGENPSEELVPALEMKRPDQSVIDAITVEEGADFSTISMEALQGYWYCDEGQGYEVFLQVEGDTAAIYNTCHGEPTGVWTGRGSAAISPPGENGWRNPALDIRDEEGWNLALIVLRRVEEDYFTTANSGVYYKVPTDKL